MKSILSTIFLLSVYCQAIWADRLVEINERLNQIKTEREKVQGYIDQGQPASTFEPFLKKFDEERKKLTDEKKKIIKKRLAQKKKAAPKPMPKPVQSQVNDQLILPQFFVDTSLPLEEQKTFVDNALEKEEKILKSLRTLDEQGIGDPNLLQNSISESELKLSQIKWEANRIEQALTLRAPAAAANVAGVNFTFSAFGDAQIQFGGGDPDNDPTFIVNDGALYLSAERNGGTALIDLPFSFKAGDGTNIAANLSDGNNFSFAQGKAQFFLSYKYDIGLSWTIGQFDTLYGYELNDTKDITFTNPGIVFGAALPTTHTGATLAYEFHPGYELKVLVSNAKNEGKRSATNMEYGAQFLFDPGMFAGAVGYLHHKNNAGVNEYLIDVVLGTKIGKLAIDIEFDAVEPADGGDTGIGVLGHFVFEATERVSFGARTEYLSKLGANHSEYQFTVGPQVKLGDSIVGKLDYTYNSAEATEGASRTETHSGALAALYLF